jgi:hypothetical protein
LLSIIFSPEFNVVSFGAVTFVSLIAGAGFGRSTFGGAGFGVSDFGGSAGLGGSGAGSTGGAGSLAGSAAGGADVGGSALSGLEEQLATKMQKTAISTRMCLFITERV